MQNVYPMVLIPRTCCRCGREFGAAGRERVCRTCRKPRKRTKGLRGAPREPGVMVTPRHWQIIRLIATEGLANKEIAFRLHLGGGEGTIKEYLHRAGRVVGLHDRVSLVLWALGRMPSPRGSIPPETL